MDTSLINKIQKSREYAAEPERVTFNALTIEFRGDNSAYTVTMGPDGWSCTCPGFGKYGICPHVMALEKMFKAMLKRDPLPYAAGQNIVSDVKKAHRYSEEKERLTILAFDATFQGDNKEHQVTYQQGKWNSTSAFFKTHGVCAYSMAMERILGDMVEKIAVPHPEPETE